MAGPCGIFTAQCSECVRCDPKSLNQQKILASSSDARKGDASQTASASLRESGSNRANGETVAPFSAPMNPAISLQPDFQTQIDQCLRAGLAFVEAQADMRPEGKETVKQIAEILKQNPDKSIKVVSYTGPPHATWSTKEALERLSTLRARTVQAHLVTHGISNPVGAKGMGYADELGERCDVLQCSAEEVEQIENEAAAQASAAELRAAETNNSYRDRVEGFQEVTRQDNEPVHVLEQPTATGQPQYTDGGRDGARESLMSEGMRAAKAGAPQGPVEGGGNVDDTIVNVKGAQEEEKEEEIEYNAGKEQAKMLASTLIFLGITGYAMFLGISARIKSGDETVCPEEPDVKMCQTCGGGGLFLPLAGEAEQKWPEAIRGVLYLIGLLWTFMGVALLCDQFMNAIEEITSSEKVVWVMVRNTKQKFHVKVWNDTVANLTLMALGSSAPEILLSVIELVGLGFFAGELGPSTIVGSAAFNLLVITAVCISAIPEGEDRKIDGVSVFLVTANFSLFAYIWLLVILQYITPDKVDEWESLVTFACFPLLVAIAFAADKGYLSGGKATEAKITMDPRQSAVADADIKAEMKRLAELYGKDVNAQTAEQMIKARTGTLNFDKLHGNSQSERKRGSVSASKKEARNSIMKGMSGGGKVVVPKAQGLVIGFSPTEYVVLECAGSVRVAVTRSGPGKPNGSVSMNYKTIERTAKQAARYHHTEGSLTFEPTDTEQYIDIPIIDNDVWEPVEYFIVQISDFVCNSTELVSLGEGTATVTVLNDDEPGVLEFETSEIYVDNGTPKCEVMVTRKMGSCGAISCDYNSNDKTAVAGKDYHSVEGTLDFKDGETSQMIEIPLLRKEGDVQSQECFTVILSNATGGAKFDADTDGGEDRAICEVTLAASGGKQGGMTSCCNRCCNRDKFAVGMEQWVEQFKGAFYCNGSPADQSTAGVKDWFFHCLCLIWKIVSAFVPPPIFFGGWGCFVIALCLIGAVTATISDLASLLGCCLGIPDDICAITLVALGTSLPDTFASKMAACQDETADNSVGNVTGSNSVNVYLGLGMPWAVGSLYWMGGTNETWLKKKYKGQTYKEMFVDTGRYPGGGFMVPAGNLGFSVMVFTATALACLALLAVRRKLYGAELGGPKGPAKFHSCVLVGLWFCYIGLSSWNTLSSA